MVSRNAGSKGPKRPSRDEMLEFVEKWGWLFERFGATRMAGRVHGWLLVCDPPRQTAREIAEALGVSIGSISTATRHLAEASLIEKVGVPGERSAYFRIVPGECKQLLQIRLGHFGVMRQLTAVGIDLLSGARTEEVDLLEEVHDFSIFMEREIPALLERWGREWKGGRGT